jgi:hypothetical protein
MVVRACAAGLLLFGALACGKDANHDAKTDTLSESASSTARVAAATDSAAQVILLYYDAIQRRDFAAAFALWSGGGLASGQSRDAFAAGFARTARVDVRITGPVSIEGAAGSQYATVPVELDTRLVDGKEQHFAGSYVVRRSMVDGATDDQRRWRIYSASIRPR